MSQSRVQHAIRDANVDVENASTPPRVLKMGLAYYTFSALRMCLHQTTHHHPVADIVIVIVVVADVVVVVVFVGV